MSDWMTPAATTVTLDGERLTIEDLAAISGGARVELDPAARARMVGSDAPVVRTKWAWIAGDAPPEGYADLVRGFVLGHCAGVGDVLPPAQVRAIVAARVNVFAIGRSGVRPELADRLLALLNEDRVPVVRAQGPVGAAGSAVLAEIARVSKVGNDQHNPGQPLHWDRTKSLDHADCLVRHLMDRGTIDSDGQRHSAKAAWRALALLQTELEEAAK